MIGRVRFFVPARRCGILQAESGEELRFSIPLEIPEVHGGDILEFQLDADGDPLGYSITIRSRWAEMLNEQHRPLVNAFHNTVRIHA